MITLKLDTNMSIIKENGKFRFISSLTNKQSSFGELYRKYDEIELLEDELHLIKNVNVTKEEFEERKKRDDTIRENNFEGYEWDFDNNPMYWHIIDAPERYGDDKLSTVPYRWHDGEFVGGVIYKDISIFYFDSNREQVEIYKTINVIEFLTKYIEIWKEVERLNNLDNPTEI